MRPIAIFATLALALGLLAGCTTASGGATGALIGGLTGAGIGVICDDPVAGALIGTGVGMGAGSMIGHHNQEQRRAEGWVYDDVWGTSGHYEYNCYYPPQPYQPTAYQPVSYQPVSPRYQYTPEYPDRIIVNQPTHYWNHH